MRISFADGRYKTQQAAGTGTDGQITYKDQEELRLPAKVADPPQKKGVEQVHIPKSITMPP